MVETLILLQMRKLFLMKSKTNLTLKLGIGGRNENILVMVFLNFVLRVRKIGVKLFFTSKHHNFEDFMLT